jgi:flagellar biosynthesis/type III secretory pathway chaperone
MTPELIAAAVRLADALAQENRALAALDLPRAAGILDAKTRALEAFAAAQALAAAGVRPVDSREEAEQLAARLRDLAQENRRLLEHAIAVQGRVIGLVARAVPSASGQGGTQYGSDGGLAGGKRPGGIALSCRA